ncbi:hypothetical protein M3C63_08745 [Brevibacterium luteolum]|uniref:hypothetical protein n=1 Tax=Brevibacterium luteolum TaxID=199591 RepID=UPI00223BA5E7|nr:hypothetical protein [Brevibacterium luteolum]MCT1921943.1 hypothetical protein [Brevibacterium luteolum]
MYNNPHPGESHNAAQNQQPAHPPMAGRAQQEQTGSQQWQFGANGAASHASAPKNPYFDFNGYQTRLPTSWPSSVREALPSLHGGFGRIFQTAHMPMDARIGYWIWLVGCALTIVGWFVSIATILIGILFSPFILVASGMMSLFGDIRWGVILFYVATMILQLIMLIVQLSLTLKLREGAEWARTGLVAVVVAGVVYASILTAADVESGGVGTVVTAVIALLLVAIFWLPQANAWFIRTTEESRGAGATNPAAGS